ncbi:hypothetical protein FQA39_LY14618 [Lamprigera yunnana]|nr:hypothetical protein FQA39_LY14618 [Lamprigera yunnana]
MEKEENKENIEKNKEQNVISEQNIMEMLKESNIDDYDPEVVTHLSDYMNNYVTSIFNSAITYMKHAGRDNITLADITLAVETLQLKAPSSRLSVKELIDLAQEHNKENLKKSNGLGVLIGKGSDHTLSKNNYKLKSALQNVNQKTLDITNWHNHMMSLNSIKNHTTVPTLIRTSAGTVSLNVPMNLAPQRIILKQPLSTTSNMTDEKRIKLEERK